MVGAAYVFSIILRHKTIQKPVHDTKVRLAVAGTSMVVLRAARTQHSFQRTIPDSSSFRFVSEFPIYPTDSASFRFSEFPVRFMSLRYSAYDSRFLPAPSLRLLCHYPFPALHLRFASAFPCAFLISAYSGFPHFPYLAFPDFPYSTVYLVYKAVA